VTALVRLGFDAFMLNRRVIGDFYGDPRLLPLMYADHGEMHPGYDCIVFERELAEAFVPFTSIVGRPHVMRGLQFNLVALAARFTVVLDAHATFHIGDDTSARAADNADYDAFNRAAGDAVWQAHARDPLRRARLEAFRRQARAPAVPDRFFGKAVDTSPIRRLRRYLARRIQG
jgi:hypothetical protein